MNSEWTLGAYLLLLAQHLKGLPYESSCYLVAKNMDADTPLAILESASRPLIRAFSWVVQRIRLAIFRRLEGRLVPGEIEALRAARASLGGSVLAAIPFRNLGSPSQFLAVARQSSDEERDLCFTSSSRPAALTYLGGRVTRSGETSTRTSLSSLTSTATGVSKSPTRSRRSAPEQVQRVCTSTQRRAGNSPR